MRKIIIISIYIFSNIAWSSEFSYYINLNSSFTEQGTILSLDLENNYKLTDNNFISGGLTTYYSFKKQEQFDNKNIFNNSLYFGLKHRFLNVTKDKKINRSVTLEKQQVIITTIEKNKNFNNENGLYVGYNRHYNTFNNGETVYSNEYLIQYEFKKYFLGNRLKLGYKFNDLEYNKNTQFNLHSITLGISFD